MSLPRPPEAISCSDRLGLNSWLQRFLTIITGMVVAVIAWTVIERFLHILVLLLAGFLVAFLLGPLGDRLEGRGLRRILAIVLRYLTIFEARAVGVVLLSGPLTAQVQGLVTPLPTLLRRKNCSFTNP